MTAPRLLLRNLTSRALAWLQRRQGLLFFLLILIHLIPIWAFTYLPTTDGPAHLANADILRKYNDPELEVFRKYYTISSTPSPNLAGHLLLLGFLKIVPPVLAEKLLLSLYIILLPLGLRYAARSIRPKSSWIGFLAFPMIYSFLLGQGFYNFCLSLPAFLFTVGYWFRYRDKMDLKRGLALGGLSILLYSCHLFSLVMACAVIGLMACAFVIAAWRDPAARGNRIRQSLIAAAALLPMVILAVIFRPSTQVPWLNTRQQPDSLREDLIGLLQFRTMVSYRDSEKYLGGALVSLLVGLSFFALVIKFRRRRWSASDALLLAPLAMAVAYLRAGDPLSIYFYIPHRAMFYCFLTLILWLAAQPISRRIKAIAPLLASILALGFVASHALKYRQFAPQLREFVSAGDSISRGSTFLPLIFAPQGAGRAMSIDVAPFYMAGGYIAARRDAVDLRNYEARTDHFPVRFKPELNPYQKLAVGLDGFDRIPPRVDFAAFEQAGGRVDYVLLWGVSDEQRKDPDAIKLFEQLKERFAPIDLPGAQWTELWKRK